MNNRNKPGLCYQMVIHALLIFTALTTASHAVERQSKSPSEQAAALQPHIQSLNELTERRRLNTLLLNEQSLSHGQQMSYVNVGTGNVTFTRRDLVLISRMPLIFSRVYDSSLVSPDLSGDFSPGWRLSLAETIRLQANGNLHYSDDSASIIKLLGTEQGFIPAQPFISDIKQVVMLNPNQLQLQFKTGLSKTFTLLGGQYRLTRIDDRFGNHIQLSYNAGYQLQNIDNNYAQQINISRDGQGRVKQITDHHQRQVIYHYINDQLTASTDLGGYKWRYQYGDQGQLHKVIDPQSRIAALFDYYQTGQHQGKARRSRVNTGANGAVDYRFSYRGNQTLLKDQQQNVSTFSQNELGFTLAVTNPNGKTSSIELNSNLQVSQLFHQNQLSAKIYYNGDHQATHIERTINNQTETLTLQYSDNRLSGIGRVNVNDSKQASQSTQLLHQASLSPQGQPLQLIRAGLTRRFGYNQQGDLISQTETGKDRAATKQSFGYNQLGLLKQLTEYKNGNSKTARFDYNTLGQLSQITFVDGSTHRYQYNALGFRTKTQRSDGTTIDYRYNETGNLTQIRQTDRDGKQIHKETKHNARNLTSQFIVDGHMALDIEYNQNGEPTMIAYDGNVAHYGYDNLSRLTKVMANNQVLTYDYKPGEQDIRIQQDDRSFTTILSQGRVSNNTSRLSGLYINGNGNPWQLVSFAPKQARFQLTPLSQMLTSDINQDASQRRRLYNALDVDKSKQRDFDKPSNTAFKPLEYPALDCEPVYCSSLFEVTISSPRTAMVGEWVTFNAIGLIGGNEWEECVDRYAFSINGNFITSNTSGLLAYRFNSPGRKTISVMAHCHTCPVWSFQYDWIYLDIQAPPKVTITMADASSNKIKVKLEPEDAYGSLTLSLIENDGTSKFTVFENSKTGGSHEFDFAFDYLRTNTIYHTVEAIWTVGSTVKYTETERFKVLGDYRHSQYNTPSETHSTCNTGAREAYYVTTGGHYNSQCFNDVEDYWTGYFPLEFKKRLDLNGSGNTGAYGLVQIDWFCPRQNNAPVDAGNITYRDIQYIIPGCGAGFPIGNNTVAVDRSNTNLQCGDKVYIKGHGVKTVTDYCPDCSLTQLDNYTTATGTCGTVIDLEASAITIKLLD